MSLKMPDMRPTEPISYKLGMYSANQRKEAVRPELYRKRLWPLTEVSAFSAAWYARRYKKKFFLFKNFFFPRGGGPPPPPHVAQGDQVATNELSHGI